MTEKKKKFKDEINRLISDGIMLHNSMQYSCFPDEFTAHTQEKFGKEEAKKRLKDLPNFSDRYQTWYSEARSVIKFALPDRLKDFDSYYEYPKPRKEISFQNYMIKDYLQGLSITRPWNESIVVERSAAIPEFAQQLNILKAARETLESALINMESILQADLFDSEVDSARALLKAGFLRASGMICGVVIEKHLRRVCETRSITIRKKNPTIADLNQTLKDNDVISIPQWRFIQHLADIRNLCGHAKSDEPSREEISDMISGTDKVLKTVF